jgi:hypothetical protein
MVGCYAMVFLIWVLIYLGSYLPLEILIFTRQTDSLYRFTYIVNAFYFKLALVVENILIL